MYRSGKFTTNIGDDDLEIEVEWEGQADRGDRDTPPSSEMDVLSVVRADSGEAVKLTDEQKAYIDVRAWEEFYDVE